MSKYSPPRSGNYICADECDTPPVCETVCGEYRFVGNSVLHVINSANPFPVYQIIDGVEHEITAVGGVPHAVHTFNECGDYIVRWCVYPEWPDCEPILPAFYNSGNYICADECDTPPVCETVCGEYRFVGNSVLHVINSANPFPVYQIIDGVEHEITAVGGVPHAVHTFNECGDYIVRWCVYPEWPDCEPILPAFYNKDLC